MDHIFGGQVNSVWLSVNPNDIEEIRKSVMAFTDSWNHHDMLAFGKLFAIDAYFVNVGGVILKGRKEIQLVHEWTHGTIPNSTKVARMSLANYGVFKDSVNQFTDIQIDFLRKDVAITHVKWELRGDARITDPRHGVLLFVLALYEGEWLIAAAQNTEGMSKALSDLLIRSQRKNN